MLHPLCPAAAGGQPEGNIQRPHAGRSRPRRQRQGQPGKAKWVLIEPVTSSKPLQALRRHPSTVCPADCTGADLICGCMQHNEAVAQSLGQHTPSDELMINRAPGHLASCAGVTGARTLQLHLRCMHGTHDTRHDCCCMQDAWVIQERLAGQDMLMFGVFDGHGQEGKTVSHSICTNLPKALSKHAACKVRMPHSVIAPVGFRAPAILPVLP